MSASLASPSYAARLGLLQICLAGVLWGTGGLAVQLVRERVPLSVTTVSAYRMAGAALVLLLVLVLARRLRELRFSPRLVVTGLATAAYQTLYFAAVAAAGVTIATVVSLGLAPVLMTVGEAVQARRRPSNRQVVVLLLALSGLVLVSVFAGHGETGPRPFTGVALAALSGAMYALATALGRPLARTLRPLALTTGTTLVGGVVLLPFCAVAAATGEPVLTGDPVALGWLVYLSVATMALAYALLYAGLRTCRGSAATVATLLEPVTAAVAAAALLGERLPALGVAGTGLILLAVVFLEA